MSKIDIFNENAEFFEEFCNSQEDTALDRFGRERKTIEGIDSNLISTINDKIIAQGGIEILQDRGDRIDATMSQNSISSNLDDIDTDISRIDSEVSQKWDNQTTVGTGDIVRESAVPVVINETGQSDVDAISQKAFTDMSFGIGQQWVDVTSQRVSGTTYTNNTGKPIMISVSMSDTQRNSISVFVDDINIAMASVTEGYRSPSSLTVIVPPKSKYKVVGGFRSFVELR